MDSASINGEVHVAQGLFKAPESGAGGFLQRPIGATKSPPPFGLRDGSRQEE